MKIAHINAVPYGSTGHIMFQLADAAEAQGDEVLTTCGFTWRKPYRRNHFVTSGLVEKYLHMKLAYHTGRLGYFSTSATKKLINRIRAFNPDIVHLHNLHGWYLNLPMLFGYLKESGTTIVWTLHDCWAFTGHCSHFDMIGCSKWKVHCENCPGYRNYPESRVDRSRELFDAKREWFSGLPNMTLVTPSEWLASKVGYSFLDKYPCKVINNGVDLSVFYPRKRSGKTFEGLKTCKIVLAVSYGWDERKGIDVVCSLAKLLPGSMRIVLVGSDDKVDKMLPSSIVSIHRTQDQEELAELYSMADVFINPTREENFPTVNMEALACGTPVVTFDTGGSPEIIDDSCGIVVPKGHVEALAEAVRFVCDRRPFSQEACCKRAKRYDQRVFLKNYLDLYRSLA